MGSCCSSSDDEMKQSRAIERKLKIDNKKSKLVERLLLIGPGNAGKSTVLKNFRKVRFLGAYLRAGRRRGYGASEEH